MDSSIEKFIKEVLLTLILLVTGTIYSIKLYYLNKELIGLNTIQIIQYRNGIAFNYFFGAIILVILASYIIYCCIKSRREIEFDMDIILLILLVLLSLCMGILVIYLIQNPILRAILAAVIVGGIISSSNWKNVYLYEKEKVMRKYGRFVALLICAFMFTTCFESAPAFAKSKRTKKPTKVNHRTIKTKAYKTSAKITFKKGKRASRYIIFYKAKNARKWKTKTIRVRRSRTQKVTLYRLKKGTKYYVEIQGFKYKRVGKRWKRIRHRWRRVARYKKVKGTKSRTISFTTKSSKKINKDMPNMTEKEYIEKAIKEDEGVSLKYGDATIHLGQTWTEELNTKLGAGSDSEVKKLFRPKFIEFSHGNEESRLQYGSMLVDCDIYCYGTKFYNNFLRVNVVGGRILGWETNGETLGVVDGTEAKRGPVIDEYENRGATSEIKKYDGTSKDWFGHLPEGATLIGGFEANETKENGIYYERSYDITEINKIKGNIASDEKMIGLYYVNAIRKLAGSEPMVYNEYLDGGDKTWQTTDEFVKDAGRDYKLDPENNPKPKLKTGDVTRYGAQAEVETISESIKYGQEIEDIQHSMYECKHGTLAGQIAEEWMLSIFYASGKTVIDTGGNNGGGGLGEDVASLYFDNRDDQKHSGSLLSAKHKFIGIGLSGSYHVEEFGKEKK